MFASTSSSAIATPSLVASGRDVRPDLDLDRRVGREAGDADRAARRAVTTERLRVDVVDLPHVPDRGREDRDLGDVGERAAAVGEDRGDVRERLPGLIPETRWDLAGRGIEADLTREHEPVAGAHRGGIRTRDRRRVRGR